MNFVFTKHALQRRPHHPIRTDEELRKPGFDPRRISQRSFLEQGLRTLRNLNPEALFQEWCAILPILEPS